MYHNYEHPGLMLDLLWITVLSFRNHKDISTINFKRCEYIAKRYNYIGIVIVKLSYLN